MVPLQLLLRNLCLLPLLLQVQHHKIFNVANVLPQMLLICFMVQWGGTIWEICSCPTFWNGCSKDIVGTRRVSSIMLAGVPRSEGGAGHNKRKGGVGWGGGGHSSRRRQTPAQGQEPHRHERAKDHEQQGDDRRKTKTRSGAPHALGRPARPTQPGQRGGAPHALGRPARPSRP